MSTSSDKRSQKDMGEMGIPSNSFSSTAEANSISGIKHAIDQPLGVYYPLTSCYDYHYPGYNGTFPKSDDKYYLNTSGGSYTGFQPDNTSILYYLPGYGPYTPSEYLQQPCPYGSEPFPCYTYDLAYTTSGVYGPGSVRSVAGSSGSVKSNGFNIAKTNSHLSSKNSALPFASNIQQTASPQSRATYQNHSINPLNKSGSNFLSSDLVRGFHSTGKVSAAHCNSINCHSKDRTLYNSYQFWSKEKNYRGPETKPITEFTCGPRADNTRNCSKLPSEAEKHDFGIYRSKYNNLKEFRTDYDSAKFFVIKSYSEDDVHKCIKYGVWSSTLNGNKKLHDAFCEAEATSNETGIRCPVFLFFSVNGSGQFVGVAEMIGQVDFDTNMDFWQLDKWNGFFPIKWHVVKDLPNTLFRDIILVNNENRPVTYSRDTQEIGLKQGLEMLSIFKGYSETTSVLDDFYFYENREMLLKAKRDARLASQVNGENHDKKANGELSVEKNIPEPSSLVSLMKNLQLE